MQSCLLKVEKIQMFCFDSKSETSTEGEENQFRQDGQIQEGNIYRGGSSKAKSSLCKNFTEKGYCPYGAKCQFAHGPQQLKINMEHNRSYKTKACHAFAKKGYCCYGQRCNFIHQPEHFEIDPVSKWRAIYSNHRHTFRALTDRTASRLIELLDL